MLVRALMIAPISLASGLAHADTLKSESELRSFAESVMKQVGANDLAAAFKQMQPYVVISESEFQTAVLSSKSQREQYGARYGSAVGYEYIEQKKVGDSLLRITFIEKTEKHALPWTFYFYKSSKGWVLNSFSWSDKVQVLFTLNQ